MSTDQRTEDKEYLEELKRLKDHETKNKRVKKILQTEIKASERKMKYEKLLNDKKLALENLQYMEGVQNFTSSLGLREGMGDPILPLKKVVQHLNEEIIKQEMAKDDLKNRLIQCEEMLALIFFSVSDGSEFDEEPGKTAEVSKESSWLITSQTQTTDLDSYHNGLPTTAIIKFVFSESDKYAKISVAVPGLEESDKNKLKPALSEHCFSLLIADVKGRNYKMIVTDLTEAVDVENSKIRVFKDKLAVFLKKILPKTWKSLTSPKLTSDKEAIQRFHEDVLSKFNEEAALLKKLENIRSGQMQLVLLMENGFYSVYDFYTAEVLLKAITELPPKMCKFYWKDELPDTEDILCEAIEAVAQNDCCVSWINLRPWSERKQSFDDKHLKLLTSGKCHLVHFSGRVSSKCWSLIPESVLEVTAIITCTDDIRALLSCPTVFDLLYVCFERQMPLTEMLPLRASASEQPISLAFSDVTDADVEWLLEAIDVLLPKKTLQTLLQVRDGFQVHLPKCEMSEGGHTRLCRRLPVEAVRVRVHDNTNSPIVRTVSRQMYENHGFAFMYFDKFNKHCP